MIKRFAILAAALLAAAGLYAQETLPPVRGEVSYDTMEPYLQAYFDATLPNAKAMLDGIDAEKNLRKGTQRFLLDGQEVYYEAYSLSASLMAKRLDGSEPQSLYSEGPERRTGREYKVKEGIGDQPFVVRTERAHEGIWWGVDASYKYESSDTKTTTTEEGTVTETKEQQKVAVSLITAWYSPMKVHFKELKEIAPVYEGGTGAAELLLTDLQDRYCLDDYIIDVESSNPEIFTLPVSQVITGKNGRTDILIKGVKEGKAKLTAKIHLSDPDTGSYVDAEKTIEIEVKPAEEWKYSFNVHDAYMEPADDYVLTGSFKVIQTMGADSLVHYQMKEISDATKSNAGSYPVDGGFMDELNPEKGLVFGFNLQQSVADAKLAEKNQKAWEKEFRRDIMRLMKCVMFGKVETFTYQSSTDPISVAIVPFSEGTHTFEFSAATISEMSGIEIPMDGSTPAPMPQKSEEEMRQQMMENMQAKMDGKHCLVLPEFKKMLFVQVGNMLLLEYKGVMLAASGASMTTMTKELMCVRGSCTLTRVK